MNNDDRSLTHEKLVDSFDEIMNSYDADRRLAVLIDDFLSEIDLEKAKVLDAGCGTGIGSKKLIEKGSDVTSVDLGFKLVKLTSQKAKSTPTQASILNLPFESNLFDIVFSTEVIEHIPDPLGAITELWRVIKPGGWLTLSTPNYLWQGPVRFASLVGLRPYDGYENFIRPVTLRNHIHQLGGKIIEHRGIHLFPFQLKTLHKINRNIDQFGKTLLPIMINQAILCQKL
jgi:2-polyprenyl-3-methyl-5-hydroxy-6-metoxy-1,4-benzoquinol methylase